MGKVYSRGSSPHEEAILHDGIILPRRGKGGVKALGQE